MTFIEVYDINQALTRCINVAFILEVQPLSSTESILVLNNHPTDPVEITCNIPYSELTRALTLAGIVVKTARLMQGMTYEIR